MAEAVWREPGTLEYYRKKGTRYVYRLQGEFDAMFIKFGMEQSVPPNARYTIMTTMIFMPFFCLCFVFFFVFEDYDEV